MNTHKPRLRSKTVVVNSVLLALGLAVLNVPELAEWIETLPPTYSLLALIVVTALNVALRESTSLPLAGWWRSPPAETPRQPAKK